MASRVRMIGRTASWIDSRNEERVASHAWLATRSSFLYKRVADVHRDRDSHLAGLNLRRCGSGTTRGGRRGGRLHITRGAGRTRLIADRDHLAELRAARADECIRLRL